MNNALSFNDVWRCGNVGVRVCECASEANALCLPPQSILLQPFRIYEYDNMNP